MMAHSNKSTHSLVFLLYSLSTAIRPTLANCYWPNGTDRNDAAGARSPDQFYAACHPDAKASMCCAIGPARQSNPDMCTSNGLCLGPDGVTWWRESCTDQSWTDPACVQLYVNGTYDGRQNSGNDVSLTMCPDGSYCPGIRGAATPCCNNNQGYFILTNLTVTQQNPNTSPSVSISPATSTSIASSPSSTVAPASLPASPSSGLSTGAKAGIGIGAAIAALAILAILGLLFWVAKLRRSAARGRIVEKTPDVAPPPSPQHHLPTEAQSKPIHEVYGTPGTRSDAHPMVSVEMEQPSA